MTPRQPHSDHPEVYDFGPLAFFILNQQGRILKANLAATHMLGVDQAMMLLRPMSEFVAAADRNLLQHLLQRSFAEPTEARGEVSLEDSESALRTILLTLRGAPDGHCCYVVAHDISERKRAEQVLFDAESRWKFAVEGSGDSLWDWDLSTDRIFFSPRLAEILGFTDDDNYRTRQDWSARVHADDLPQVRKLMRQHLESRTSSAYTAEYRMRCQDGSYKWILARGLVFDQDANGKPLRMVGTHTDITDRKQAELELRATQQDLADTLSAIPDLLFELGLDGRYHDYKTANSELLVAPPEQLIGKTVSELLPESAAATCLQALKEANAVGSSKGLRYELVLGGKTHWFELAVSRKMGQFEDGPRFIAIARDITQQKILEDELRVGAKAFESQQPMMIMGPHRTVVRVNRAMCELTGFASHELIGRQCHEIFDQHLIPEPTRDLFWAKALETGECSGELLTRHQSGEVLQIWFSLTVVKNERSEITHFLGTANDITLQKRMREENEAREAAQRDALVSEVHHRIKNNLQGIVGILRESARRYPETSQPIAQAVGQIQSIAVIHGLQGEQATERVRLCELTVAIASNLTALWNIAVQVDIPEPWLPRQVHSTEAVPIALILNELILNAIKHSDQTQPNVRVEIGSNGDPNRVWARITNNGQWSTNKNGKQMGLKLVTTLMPRHGANLTRTLNSNTVETLLELVPPVVLASTATPA